MGRPRTPGWSRPSNPEPPDGLVRQSQAVGTYGPGAMIDLVDQAVLVGGLDYWMYGDKAAAHLVPEPRLREDLAPFFEAIERTLEAFRAPPIPKERDNAKAMGIQVLEFPAWFVCQNPACRALVYSAPGRLGLEQVAGRWRHRCDRSAAKNAKKETRECVPVRFLGACRRGHCEEWRWIDFVHHERGRCPSPQLSLDEGATGDFSEVVVRCVCTARRELSAVYRDARLRCGGRQPWLGRDAEEPCDEDLVLLVRTASNSYFPLLQTALSVPSPGKEVDDAVSAVWDVIANTTAADLPTLRRVVPRVASALTGHSDSDVMAAIERRRGKASVHENLRVTEFRTLSSSAPERPSEQPRDTDELFARSVVPAVTQPLPAGVARVVVASKLREVRAQLGFTRVAPIQSDIYGEIDLTFRPAMLGRSSNWLPAVEVRGEGVFVQLDEEHVREWESSKPVKDRGDELIAGHDAWVDDMRRRRGSAAKLPAFPGLRFYLLHSLSHLLMTAISLECGYAASAIRERIYSSRPKDAVPMAAFLLSTGTTGSEGTLGGLVEEGRVLRDHLRAAFDIGVLCSNDPVCAGHTPRDDHAERWLEGAACHGCLFVAECSCERFNTWLDRALVVPTIGHPAELAFFSERP